MHGSSSGSILLVNAEVDSMGGVADSGVGTSLKTSPRRAALERAELELRQELNLREDRKKELEFLHRGGNPLDYKYGSGASLSVQSTSLTGQQIENFTSEGKVSVALSASPHADSVESSGIPGGPSGAENLPLLDGNNETHEGDRSSLLSRRKNETGKLEQPSQVDKNQNAKESEDSAIFRPYSRRNRSRSNRDGARSTYVSTFQTRGHISYPARGGSKDGKALVSENNDQKGQTVALVSDPRHANSNGDMLQTSNQLAVVPAGERATKEAHGDSRGGLPEDKLNIDISHSLKGEGKGQPLEDVSKETSLASGGLRVDHTVSAVPEQLPCETTEKDKEDTRSGQINGSNDLRGHQKSIPNDGQDSNAVISIKGLDSESSCTQTSIAVDVNNDTDVCVDPKTVASNRLAVNETSDRAQNLGGFEMGKEKNENGVVDVGDMRNGDCSSLHQDHTNGVVVKVEEDRQTDKSGLQHEVKCQPNSSEVEQHASHVPNYDKEAGCLLVHNANLAKETSIGNPMDSMDISISELPHPSTAGRSSIAPANPQASEVAHLMPADKDLEDSILEEARKIEAKRKRIANLSIGTLHMENRKKSHWDFVLEEMAWLANDFAQERLWKISAASQLCHQVADAFRSKLEMHRHRRKLKKVAYTLAKAVRQFWHRAEVHLKGDCAGGQEMYSHDSETSLRVDRHEVPGDKSRESDTLLMNASSGLEEECQRKSSSLPVQEYALKFLKYNSSSVPSLLAKSPETSDLMPGTPNMSQEDKQTEESLFYAVPSGAMEAYRKSIESYLAQYENSANCMREEVETSMYDGGTEFGYQENAYDEDEGETNTYYMAGTFATSKPNKHVLKKRKNSLKFNSRAYEFGGDTPYGPSTSGTQQSILMGKRPSNNLHVGPIPTKRMRTASRQRVISPYGAVSNGVVQAQARTDASSGDTSSLQDDQSTLHGVSQIQRSVEVESVGEFEKRVPYDSAETSKPKKKKKTKHSGATFEQGWQLEPTAPIEQRDNCRKRLEAHHFDSNGTSGLYGHHSKKPKMMKQSLDNNFDSAPMPGSIPSPVASQMSNMPNPDKIIKLIGGRERGRKAKVLKMSTVQSGSGSPWSLFEDQALVVLVHDMGPNWELISDAINSTLHFKRIYRKPQECKERHKILMDRSSGDGPESAEDSGSSQSYPSTLPGIPKGSARQLFQRLQGPMEEDTIKSHFEKIIMIGQKLHYRKNQDKPNPKHLQPVHNSHYIALSQVCPNNPSGGVLKPSDLCDTTTPNAEGLPLGYQSSHASSLSLPNQGAVPPMLPNTGVNTSLHGSSGMVLGSTQPLPSGSLNPSVREGRYSVPRSSSLSVDEQRRMQQYNQMFSGRNIRQSSFSAAGTVSGTDRGVRMLPGGTSMGMMSGMNRGMAMPRPGYQGLPSSSMVNSGSMLSSGAVGMQNPVNMHSGAGPGQGNSMMRSREPLQTMRSGNNPENSRQMMAPELQVQVTPGNGQGVSPFSGLSSAYPNQTTSPPVQAFPGHAQQQSQISPQQSHALGSPHDPTNLQGSNHTPGSQQQAYAIRLAKEQQLQQQYLRQKQHQQQFATSNTLVPHAQLQPPFSVQNSSQIPPQSTSHVSTLPPLTPSSPMTAYSSQPQQKHLSYGIGRNPQTTASGLNNQMGKQRQQHQQLSQSSRSHPQQRQQSHSQQQAKVLKGVGRGNLLVHQNLGVDPSHMNGLSMTPANQSAEKGEQIMHLMQGQGYSSGVNTVQPSKPYIPPQSSNQSQLQQKLYSGPNTPSSKQLQHMPSQSESRPQNHIPAVPSAHTYSASHQAVPQAIMASSHQQLQVHPTPHHKQVNNTLSTNQRVPQQNRQVNPDPSSKFSCDHAQSNQHSLKHTSQVASTTTVPQSCTEPLKVPPVVSDAVASQWKASESLYDPSMSNPAPQVGTIGSPPLANSNGGEPISPLGHGLGQRQLSSSLTPVGHSVGAQWEQPPPVHQFPTPPTSAQHQSQEQLILHEQQQSSQQ